MFDWVPILQYTHYFDLLVLFLVLFAVFQCFTNQVLQQRVIEANALWGSVIIILIILYMGFRPERGPFGDSIIYAHGFYNTNPDTSSFSFFGKEWAFRDLTIIMAKIGNLQTYFFSCSLIYVGSLWWAMKRIFGNYFWIPLLVILSMFTFWNYGVNGIRNGMGASVFILAITFANNIPVMILLAYIAIGFHTSVWLMIGAAVLGWLYKKTNIYLTVWVACVIISWFWGATIQAYLGALSLFGEDDRFSGYLLVTQKQQETQGFVYEMRFRWDFLLYSAMAVAVGYYFIFRRKFNDEYYHWIYNTYLITNAFWVLIIRAQYTNRFAQISWFIMPIVLIYPFMKKRFWNDHERKLGLALLGFYAFAFYYNIIK